ncbi:sodium-dependent glucose transporter 1A-like isoform X1 [Stegodyphus dumicola]|uniref:sodium-dependent glucose transporter 1A-like isoform X1 n=3 Tax=Stegodyphus dumicola TaxID=202533 RepID=UPI0015B2AF54|nr:sodium-dependent glucose transporter 1A-like isoform X1 [Stegodyphus dumicola]
MEVPELENFLVEESSPAIENKKMFRLFGRTLDVARTGVHYFMFVILGLMVSIPGPTLIDLRHSSGTDSSSISLIFSARSAGYLLGSLIGGFILDSIKNEEKALIISSMFVAMGAYVIPWCRSLVTLLTTFAITGFAMGFSNTGSNACCLRIWGKKGAPFLQGLHFAYGLGGFFAPILAAPFLSAHVPTTTDLSLLGVTHNFTNELPASINFPQNISDLELRITASETHTIPTITVAYSIIGILATLVTGCFTFVYIFASKEKSAAENSEQESTRDPGRLFTCLVVILICLQTGLISGVEVSFTQMLTSYVVKSIHSLSKVTGSYMTSVYWGAFTLMRGLSIILACKISVKSLLIFDLLLSVAAALVLLTIGTWSVTALWVGTAMLGIGVASIFPASLSWVEKYININNRIASIFTLVSSILEMTVPHCISIYLGSQPNVLFQFMTGATISSSVLFIISNIIFTRKGEKYIGDKKATSASKEEKEPTEKNPAVSV